MAVPAAGAPADAEELRSGTKASSQPTRTRRTAATSSSTSSSSPGQPLDVGNLQLPVSLGQVDSEFSHVSAALIFDVIRRSPSSTASGWDPRRRSSRSCSPPRAGRHMTVPFYFSVKSANRFARNIRLPPGRARLQKVLRLSGGSASPALAFRVRDCAAARCAAAYDARPRGSALRAFRRRAVRGERASYGLVADRGAATLNLLYPGGRGAIPAPRGGTGRRDRRLGRRARHADAGRQVLR